MCLKNPPPLFPGPQTRLPFKLGRAADTRSAHSQHHWKKLKQLVAAENYALLPVHVPTYANIAAPPSVRPAKKYCDLTGLEAPYTDPRTKVGAC